MTRFLRIVVPGWVRHVTQRWNHRQTVFFSDQDRHTYLSLLQKHFSHHELGLIGFCLMDNHVHLLVIPLETIPGTCSRKKTIQQRVRNSKTTGRLLGNVEVAKQLEQMLGRSILPRKKGRRPAGISAVRKLGN